jgi:hypothetical protein
VSPTPNVEPGAGIANVIPKSDRFSEPCAENPTRAWGSSPGCPRIAAVERRVEHHRSRDAVKSQVSDDLH